MKDPCPLFHTRRIEWCHSHTAVDPALRPFSSPKFTHLRVPLTHSLIAFNQVNLTAPSEPVRAGRHVRGPLTVPMTVVDSTAAFVRGTCKMSFVMQGRGQCSPLEAWYSQCLFFFPGG